MHGVPVGTYTSVSFIIGVDSLRNCSGAQTGDLDPSKGMFWDWTSGYIMAWLEGTSPKSPASGQKIIYQAVGFSGQDKVMRNVTLSFGGNGASVTSDHIPEIHISSDVNEWFKTPSTISINSMPTVAIPGPSGHLIADNYADMFKFVKVIN
jgi:hypothetical protein